MDIHQKINKVNKYKQWILLISIIFTSLVVLSVIYVKKIVPISESKGNYISYNSSSEKSTEEILVGDKIKQYFKIEEEISSILIKFNTFGRENTSELNVFLKNESENKIVKEWSVKSSEIKNNEYFNFNLDNNFVEVDDKEYSINIQCLNGKEGESVALHMSSDNKYSRGNLFINDVKQTGDIAFGVNTKDSLFLENIFIGASIIIILFLIFIYIAIFIKKFKIENVFVFAGLVLGIIYIFLITPYSSYDEPAHVDTVYRYSNDLLGLGHSTESGGMLRREEDSSEGLAYTGTTITTYRTVYDNLFTMSEKNNLIDVPGRYIKEAPYVYLPSTVAITLARVIGLGQIPLLILGRLANLLVYIAACYFAIRKIPIAKILMFTIALLPMSLHQATSFSYDAVIMSVAFFFTAYCLNIVFSKKDIKKKDYILFYISAVLLAPLKIVYVLLCGLILLIPKKRFHSKKKYYLFMGGLFVSIIISFLIVNFTAAIGVVTETQGTAAFSTLPSYTFGDILRDPIHFINVLLNSISVSTTTFISLMVTGFYMIKINSIFTIAFLVILVLSSFKIDEEDIYVNGIKKLLIGGIVGILLLVLHMVGYTWTVAGENVIQGVQGRYLLPALPIMMLLFRNNNLVFRKSIDQKLMFSVCVLQVMVVCNAFLSVLVLNS